MTAGMRQRSGTIVQEKARAFKTPDQESKKQLSKLRSEAIEPNRPYASESPNKKCATVSPMQQLE